MTYFDIDIDSRLITALTFLAIASWHKVAEDLFKLLDKYIGPSIHRDIIARVLIAVTLTVIVKILDKKNIKNKL